MDTYTWMGWATTFVIVAQHYLTPHIARYIRKSKSDRPKEEPIVVDYTGPTKKEQYLAAHQEWDAKWDSITFSYGYVDNLFQNDMAKFFKTVPKVRAYGYLATKDDMSMEQAEQVYNKLLLHYVTYNGRLN